MRSVSISTSVCVCVSLRYTLIVCFTRYMLLLLFMLPTETWSWPEIQRSLICTFKQLLVSSQPITIKSTTALPVNTHRHTTASKFICLNLKKLPKLSYPSICFNQQSLPSSPSTSSHPTTDSFTDRFFCHKSPLVFINWERRWTKMSEKKRGKER